LHTASIVGSTDETPPTGSITSPSSGTTVTGTTTVTVNATDDVAVRRVELLVHGDFAAASHAAPWRIPWHTDDAASGPATLTLKIYDTSANVASSTSSVDVTVNNPTAAVFDAQLQAPACRSVQRQCDTFGLVNGRGPIGPEPNTPNTIHDS